MIDPKDAFFILQSIGIAVGAEFYTLDRDRVERLLDAANNWKYRQPKNANGSRVRYFHEYLQRRAALVAV